MYDLAQLEAGATRCLFSTDPPATCSRLLAWGATQPEGVRIALCPVDLSRSVNAILDQHMRSLAEAALLLWPDWYGEADLFRPGDEASLQRVLDRLIADDTTRRKRGVLRLWLVPAIRLCRSQKPPIVPDVSATVQLQQLALALASEDLILVVHVTAPNDPDAIGLLALARDLEWLGRHLSARVVAVLPVSWSGRAELDGISWAAHSINENQPAAADAPAMLDEPVWQVSPIRGRPHPNSPGEQLLAQRLSGDPSLGSLFEFNKPVQTVRGNRYQVDLVWTEGLVAVEVDGYRSHSSPEEFAKDRQRDYELQLSGYLVLRLTHASVMSDPDLAIDKIRDFVTLRTRQPLPTRTNQ